MISWYCLTVICLTLADREFIQHIHITSLLVYLVGATAAVELSCAGDQNTRYCINEEVQHQCTSPPAPLHVLVWIILDDQGTKLGAKTLSKFDSLGTLQPIPGADGFSTALISNSGNTLVSNISFSASESLNGYTIQCIHDQVGGPTTNRTCDIIIAGMHVL